MQVLLIFLDGVGLGIDDPASNPFLNAQLPTLRYLLGGQVPLQGNGAVVTERATLVPTDATLGVAGLPQSATGQAALFTGVNAPRLLGRHYGPYPDATLRRLVAERGVFGQLAAAGKRVAFANAFPHRYLDRLKRGTARCSVTSWAAQAGGVRLRDYDDLYTGRALSAFITNEAWRDVLSYTNVPMISANQAGLNLARLVADHDFTCFEHFHTDIVGHKADPARTIAVLEQLDAFLGGVLAGLDLAHVLLIVTSDHGNVEDWTTRKHTLNPVPTLLVGVGRQIVAERIVDLTDLAPALLDLLDVKRET